MAIRDHLLIHIRPARCDSGAAARICRPRRRRRDIDIDLLVTRSEGTSLLDQAALMLALESLLGRKVDIASDGWVKPSIRERRVLSSR